MKNDLYSIRMRASFKERHISGAERIVSRDELDAVSADLHGRALNRKPEPDRIVLTIESLSDLAIDELPCLSVTSFPAENIDTSRARAAKTLMQTGVAQRSIESAFTLLDRGAASSGSVMRGAVLMKALSGKRLEPDQERGVRVSRFDWLLETRGAVQGRLDSAGLGHFRTQEALALATKVAHAPGVIAELCWSDDPEYTAGYVASRNLGYCRFPMLKGAGTPLGGRIFFVREDLFDIRECIYFLEQRPALISGIPDIIEIRMDGMNLISISEMTGAGKHV